MNTRRVFLLLASVGLALSAMTGCRPSATTPPATSANTTPTVGDTVKTGSGEITLESVTTTLPADWGWSRNPPTLWLRFRFVNTTDGTVTVSGFRGAPEPKVTGADGSSVDVGAKRTSFEGGSGGYGLGRPEAVYLGPRGFIVATFGLRPTEAQYAADRLPLTVIWKPTGDQAATFEVK